MSNPTDPNTLDDGMSQTNPPIETAQAPMIGLPQPVVRRSGRRIGRRAILVIAVVASLGIGVAIGNSTAEADATSDGKTPVAETTVTATAPVVYVTETVTAAPAASAADNLAQPTTAPTPTPIPTPASKTVLNTKGSGIKNTAKFTTSDDWTIHWTYNCSSFGMAGNFSVMIYTDGEVDDVAVNELGKKGSDSSPIYDDAGAHYLSVNSECSWTLKVTTD